MKDALGEILMREGLITAEQLRLALEEQKRTGNRIGSTLVRLGFLSEATLAEFLGKKFDIPSVDLSTYEVDEEAVNLIPLSVARKYLAIPIARAGRRLVVAMADPYNIFAIDGIKFVTRLDVDPVVAPESAVVTAIDRFYEDSDTLKELLKDLDSAEVELVEGEQEDLGLTQLKAQIEEAPVVKLINGLLSDAVKKGASDIHIEPYERALRIRYRIDGTLRDMMYPPLRMKAALISRVKILADMDIAERRLPQDGRIKMRMGSNVIDFRVSTVPTLFGEKIVLRILDRENVSLDLESLGFVPEALAGFLAAIRMPYGMVLVTGPTGSGKTTTLYSAVTRLNTPEVNILTVEDPIEYHLDGINQVQVNVEIGVSFATVLRAFLRQDPNIIMVGEIRDTETAKIAIKAALTGHLVLSTVHTNDAASAVVRLVDMGIEPFLVASAVNCIVAQRLVRRICRACRQPIAYPPEALRDAGQSPEDAQDLTFYRGTGCPDCSGTGYRGRCGLYEVMPISPAIREMILEGASSTRLKERAIQEGMLSLRADGLAKFQRGVSTLEEVLKETTLF